MSKVRIKKVKSSIRCLPKQVATLEALGLGKIDSVVEKEKTPQIEGMLRKVSHLVEVEEI